ncbi:hypothetical protein ACSMXN_01455 [Jatrophihabitans sp. DSM 45814]
MPKVICYHDVKDRDLWLASEVRGAAFSSQGVTDLRTYIDPTNPKRVGLSAEVPDVDALVTFLQTDEAAQAMATDGVVADTVVMLVES